MNFEPREFQKVLRRFSDAEAVKEAWLKPHPLKGVASETTCGYSHIPGKHPGIQEMTTKDLHNFMYCEASSFDLILFLLAAA